MPGPKLHNIDLSRHYYPFTLHHVRRSFDLARNGVEVVSITALVNATELHVAIERDSLYLVGFKAATSASWWCFKEKDKPAPAIPGITAGKQIIGEHTYPFLGIDDPEPFETGPEKLLADFAVFDGKLGDKPKRKAMLALIFFTSEAIRFDSIELAMMRFLSTHRIRFSEHSATVKNWQRATEQGDKNVLLKHLPTA